MFSFASRWREASGDHTTSRFPLGATTLIPAFSPGRAFGEEPLEFLRREVGNKAAVVLHLGFTQFVFVASPELVKRVLVTDDAKFGEGKWTQRGQRYLGDCIISLEGASHGDRRRLIQPGFRQFNREVHHREIAEAISSYTAHWRDGSVLEVRAEMGRLTLAVTCRLLFHKDPQQEHPGLFEDLRLVNSALASFPRPRRELREAQERLRQSVGQLRDDGVGRQLRAAGLADDEIDREIIALMIASIDTTPGALSWVWTELAQHPDIERKLCEKLGEVAAEDPVPGAPWAPGNPLNNVVAEVLRLHPPVRYIDRRALVDMELGGLEVRAGDYVLLSPFLSHRDPRYWSDPDRFRPERWGDRGRTGVDRFVYFPFGGGPHACIGGALAQREIHQIVATLLPKWRFRTVGTPPDPRLLASQFTMRVESRA